MPNQNNITFPELNTLQGINTQTTIQAQLDSKDTDSLTTNYILVGDAQGLSASVLMSGGATIVSSGLVTLGPNNGYATTATAAGTTPLTVASKNLQFFTGSTTQTVVLPVVTTLALGWQIRIVNNSSGNVTVNSSGGNAVVVVGAGRITDITCILITGTDAASWSAYIFNNITPLQTALTTSVTITTDYPTLMNITGLVQSFTTTRSNQYVELKLISSALAGVATTFLNISYKIDAGSDISLISPTVVAGNYVNCSFCTNILVANAGTYSIQLRAGKAGTNIPILGVTSAPEAQTTFTVTVL